MRIQSTRVWLNEQSFQLSLFLTTERSRPSNPMMRRKPTWITAISGSFQVWIDIHCHGYNGLDCNYATREGLLNWIEYLPQDGVTSFLATTSTAPESNLLESFALISKIIDEDHRGAKIQGIHVEGPQISHEFKGAHNPYLIQKPNIEQFDRYQKAAEGKIKMIWHRAGKR